jgi:hypothetical protein
MAKKRKRTPEECVEHKAHYMRDQRMLARRIVERQVALVAPAQREQFVAERLAYYERAAHVPVGSFSA